MKKMNAHRIGVDTGIAHLFSDFAEGGEMWSGEGERQISVMIEFSEAFLTPPAIHTGFSLWDMSNDSNTRVDLKTENVTEIGFTIVFTTWGDTKVARMRANWMAIGEVQNDEIWDV